MVALTTFPLIPPANAGAKPLHLRQSVSVIGSEMGTVEVQLSRPATIDIATTGRGDRLGPGTKITGDGRIAGVVLIRADVLDSYGGDLSPSETVILHRWGICGATGGCETPSRFVTSVRGGRRDDAGDVRLPAGRYIIQLLTDGGRVRVDLDLKGAPSGDTRLRPSGPSLVDFKAPSTTHLATEQALHMYRGGAAFDGGESGLSVSLLYLRASKQLDHVTGGICQVNAPAAPPEAVYGPQCYLATAAGLGTGAYMIDRSIERELIWEPLMNYHSQGIQPPNLDGSRGIGTWLLVEQELEAVDFMAYVIRSP